MIHRVANEQIIKDLAFFPAVSIIGPRQVGKTTLARQLPKPQGKAMVYLDMEWEEDRSKLSDAGAYLLQHEDKCVVIDEVQIMPKLFPILRALIDRKREPGRFVLLGSASPAILQNSSESLAGRIAYHELSPFALGEIAQQPQALRTHWYRGGFPNAFLADDDALAFQWLTQFFTTFVERDVAQVLGKEANSVNLLRLVRMLGHMHGQELNLSALSNSLGIGTATVNRYLAILEGSFLVRRLEPYYANVGKRLTKTPKFYFRDSGFFHAVARMRNREDLFSHPMYGASWEGYVVEEIFRRAGRECDYFYYRTHGGAEVDLVLQTPRNQLICIEIKADNAPSISRGFYSSIEDLKPAKSYVITPEAERYQRSDGVIILGLQAFLESEMQDILG